MLGKHCCGNPIGRSKIGMNKIKLPQGINPLNGRTNKEEFEKWNYRSYDIAGQ